MTDVKNDMEIQTPSQGQTPTQTTPSPPAPKSPLEEAKETLENIRKEREAFAEERRQFEDLRARQMLQGQSDAGQAKLTPEQQEAAKAHEEADKIVKAFK